MQKPMPACLTCARYRVRTALQGGPRCQAFPDGIPRDITDGVNPHNLPYPGDHSLVYKKGVPKEELGGK